MVVDSGTVAVGVDPDPRDLRTFGRRLGTGLERSGRFAAIGRSIGSKLLVGIGGVFAAQKVGQFLTGAITAARDLAEAQSKSNVVFRDSAAEITRWAANGAKAFGLSKTAALDAAGGFGNMFAQLGIGSGRAADMSTSMVELAADFASFHNADITEVLIAQSAAFRGEYDALQRFLPLINAATVEQKAMEMTGKANAKQLTAQEKALAVYQLMLDGAGDAQGDFARTSDGLANQQRILKAQWENFSATIGNLLLPVVTRFVTFLNDRMIPALGSTIDVARNIGDAFQNFGEHLAPIIDSIREAIDRGDWAAVGRTIKLGLEQAITAVLPGLSGLADKIFGAVFGENVGLVIGQAIRRGDWGTVGNQLHWAIIQAFGKVDWANVGSRLGSIIVTMIKGIGGGAMKIANAIMGLIRAVNWSDLGVRAAEAATPFALGLILGIVDTLTDPIFWIRFIRDNWETILPVVLGIMFAPAKWIANLAKFLRRIPFAGRLLAWIVEAISSLGTRITTAAGSLLRSFANGFTSALGRTGPTIVSRFVRFIGSLPTYLRVLAAEFGDRARTAMEWLGRAIASHGPRQAIAALHKVRLAIGGFMRTAVSWLVAPGRLLVQGLANGARAALGLVTRVFTTIRSSISTAMNAARAVIQRVMAAISSLWGRAWQTISGVTSRVATAIRTTVTNWGNAVRAFIQRILASISSLWTSAWARLRALTTSATAAIRATVTSWLNAVRNFISTTLANIRSRWTSVWSAIRSHLAGVAREMVLQVTTAMGNIRDTVSRLMSRVQAIFASIWNRIVSSAKGFVVSVVFAIVGMQTTIIRGLTGFRDRMFELGRGIFNRFADGIRAAVSKVKSAVGGILSLFGGGGGGDGLGRIGSWIADKIRAAKAAAASAYSGASTSGLMPHLKAAARTVAGFGLRVTSGFRPGAITSTGNRSYHGMGRAIDLGPPSMAAFNKVRAAFPNATELIYTPAGNRQLHRGRNHVYTGGTIRRDHYDHIHLALARGGRIPGVTDRTGADDVIARLTRGEWVMPVDAVERYGPDFMRAIQFGRLPAPGKRERTSGASSALPGYAAGGLVRRGRSYVKALFNMLRRVRAGHPIFEDFSMRGMGPNIRRHHSEIADRFYATRRGFDFDASRRTRNAIIESLTRFLQEAYAAWRRTGVRQIGRQRFNLGGPVLGIDGALADGGVVRRPGTFLLGETGPELARLGPGDKVEPLDRPGFPDRIAATFETGEEGLTLSGYIKLVGERDARTTRQRTFAGWG